MNTKAQVGIMSEIFLLVLILSIFVLFWNFYARNTFLVGLVAVKDKAVMHSCIGILYPLVSNEYIKSTENRELKPITYFNQYLEMSNNITYPSPDYLFTKARKYYQSSGITFSIRVNNGTVWLESGALARQDLISTLLLGDQSPTAVCTLPIYSLVPAYSGIAEMKVRI